MKSPIEVQNPGEGCVKTELVWHIFRETEDGRIIVDHSPNHGEIILMHRDSTGISVEKWDADKFAEFAETFDGNPIKAGDAWAEEPKLGRTGCCLITYKGETK